MTSTFWKAMGLIAGLVCALTITSCTKINQWPVREQSGGGLLAPGRTNASGPEIIEVRGYTLTPSNSVPAGAIGYAVPIFTDRAQALKFCPLFRSQLSFDGELAATTKLYTQSYDQKVAIAPFVWPVSSWKHGDRSDDCKLMAARYNISGAKTFLRVAQRAINKNGGQLDDYLKEGPFIITARRVNDTVMIYDLSRAPDGDLGKWLRRSIAQLSDPLIGATSYVTPDWRDQIRYYIFAAIPNFQPVLKIIIPGYADEHRKG